MKHFGLHGDFRAIGIAHHFSEGAPPASIAADASLNENSNERHVGGHQAEPSSLGARPFKARHQLFPHVKLGCPFQQMQQLRARHFSTCVNMQDFVFPASSRAWDLS